MSGNISSRYRLVSRVGEGGMGAVYLAVRADQQFEQKVAVKFATGALQNPELAFRFRLEQQTLARLDHPNIVRLLDGGATEEGIPYLIMDHVDGVRLDQYATQHALTVRARIELLRKVCSAVQYAHQHLVVHRDLKPANILVTAKGEPKLLDFGIAKLLDSAAADAALTAPGVVPMTLRYGSPEQLRGDPVTVSSDLFALGVVLYELLCGRSPHYAEGLAVDAVMRRILYEEPVPPSAIAPELPAELDAIVLKTLRKAPSDRYPSVAEFSADLERFLEGRPVLARRGTWTYRTRKFIGRHKVATLSAAVFSVALIAAIGGIVWQWQIAGTERKRADARFEDVHQLARSFLFEFESAIQQVPGSAAPRVLLLQRTSEYLERLSRDAAGNQGVLLDVGEAYLKLGKLEGSPFESSVGNAKAAEAAYRRSIELEERLLQMRPNDRQALDITARARLELSDVLSSVGRAAESVAEARRAAEVFSGVARRDPKDRRALRDSAVAHLYLAGALAGPDQLTIGDRRGALAQTRTAISQYEKFVEGEPAGDVARVNLPVARMLLAYLLAADGAPLQARELLTGVEESVRRLQRTQLPGDQVAGLDEGVARVWQQLEDHAAAATYLEEAVRLRRAALQSAPKEPNSRFAVSAVLYRYGLSEAALGRAAEASASFRDGVTIMESLTTSDPDNLLWRNSLCELLAGTGQWEEALPRARVLALRDGATPGEVIRYALLLSRRDLPAAIAAARRAGDLSQHRLWEIEDTLATLSAAAGNWQDAAGAEGRAVALLETYHSGPASDAFVRLRHRWEQYQQKAKQ